MKLLVALLGVALSVTLALVAFLVVDARRNDKRMVRFEHRVIETKDAACLAYEFASQPAVSHAEELPVCREANSVSGAAFQVGREWPGEPGYDRQTGNPTTTP